MTFYDVFMYPLETLMLNKIRKELICEAQGDVLEIGFGTGVNLKYYDENKVKSYRAIDLKIDEKVRNMHQELELIETSVTQLPFETGSMDTIIATLVFCSVDELIKGISEVKRVLKDDGQYIFLEHVLPKNKVLARLFKGLNGPWHAMSSCNISRETVRIFEENGFEFKELHDRGNGIFQYGLAFKR